MKRWKEDLEGLVPLEYIKFLNVPMYESEYGSVIDLPPHFLEKLAAEAVIKERIPLRGKEVKFLRKTLSLSLEKFANKIGLTSGAIFRWEQDRETQLIPVNEIAVRTFMAEALGIEIAGKFSELVGTQEHAILLKAS
jgi:DNA-binding XRE family transcriptional regulator